MKREAGKKVLKSSFYCPTAKVDACVKSVSGQKAS
jgi:hypothetical protein